MGIETLDLTVERHWCLFFMGTLLLKKYWSIAYFRILLPSFLFKKSKGGFSEHSGSGNVVEAFFIFTHPNRVEKKMIKKNRFPPTLDLNSIEMTIDNSRYKVCLFPG
jgi:hypothetical protein